jgi:uncharacterized membrane protein HdeD (DUF308 family)
MNQALKYWWLLLIKGIILIVLSFFVFARPISALVGLALYIGISLMATGIALIAVALSNRKSNDQWGWKLTEGIVDILFAFILLSNPAVTASVFPFVVGFWMIFYGVMLFAGSFTSKKEGDGNWWISLIGGLLTVIFGYMIMSDLFTGMIAITFWIGSGFMLFGLINISIAFRMKKLNSSMS